MGTPIGHVLNESIYFSEYLKCGVGISPQQIPIFTSSNKHFVSTYSLLSQMHTLPMFSPPPWRFAWHSSCYAYHSHHADIINIYTHQTFSSPHKCQRTVLKGLGHYILYHKYLAEMPCMNGWWQLRNATSPSEVEAGATIIRIAETEKIHNFTPICSFSKYLMSIYLHLTQPKVCHDEQDSVSILYPRSL